MYSSIISGYEIHLIGHKLTIKIDYNLTISEHKQAIDKAKSVIRDIIQVGMTDYEKELAIHDYIVDHVDYDESTNPHPHVYTMYGALINGKAVCHGYAEAFRYMGYLAGLDVDLVVGEALYKGKPIGHAWNMITLDGKSYHVDTTWDDPVGSDDGIRSYAYFNVTDDVLSNDHTWIRKNYNQCNATTYNYFIYEEKVVYGLDGLKTIFRMDLMKD